VTAQVTDAAGGGHDITIVSQTLPGTPSNCTVNLAELYAS